PERVADAPDHDAHEHQGELRLHAQGGLELPLVEPDHPARRPRHRCRASRHVGHRRHLAEDLALPDHAYDLALADQADLAVDEQVHLVALQEELAALVVLGEQRRPLGDDLLPAGGAEELQRHGRVVDRRRLLGCRRRLRRLLRLREIQVAHPLPPSTLAPDALMPFAHFAISARMWAANCSRLPPIGTRPSLVMRAFMSEECMIFATREFSRSSTSDGVPAGARSPYHWLDS